MQLSYVQKTGNFKDLIQQQKAQILDTQKSYQQKFDLLTQLKTIKAQEQKYIQRNIKQINLPQLMKRIYSDKKLKINRQHLQKPECLTQQNIENDIMCANTIKKINNTQEQKPKLNIKVSTDRFQTESNERLNFMNYTFGSQFRLRGANLSQINNKSQITQKRSTSQTSRIMTNSQKRVVNKIFS